MTLAGSSRDPFSARYWQLFLLRMLVGVGFGGALPVLYSVLGDFFDADSRNAVRGGEGRGAFRGVRHFHPLKRLGCNTLPM